MSTVSLFVNAVRFVGRNSSSFLYHIRMQPKKQQQQNPQKSPKSVTIKIEIQPETNEWNIHRAHHLLSLRLELCYIRINSRIKIPSFIWIFISLVCIISDVFFLLSSLTPPPPFSFSSSRSFESMDWNQFDFHMAHSVRRTSLKQSLARSSSNDKFNEAVRNRR